MVEPIKLSFEPSPERRAIEAAIERHRRGKSSFIVAVEATGMPMIVTDPNLTGNPIVFANAAFLELTKLRMDEVIGQPITMLNAAENESQILQDINQAITNRRDLNIELMCETKTGGQFWTALFISPVFDAKGKLLHFFGAFLNITDRHRAEEDLRWLAKELDRRVQDRTHMLNETTERLTAEVQQRRQIEDVLRAALAEKSVLLAEKETLVQEANHRVKNSLQLASALLDLQARRQRDPAVRRGFEEAQKRLMAISRVHEALYQSNDVQTINFADYVRQLCHDLIYSFDSLDRIMLYVDMNEVFWSPERVIPLAMIVNELVINSLKHAFPNTRLGPRSGQIWVRLKVTGNFARLSISDDGIGMPANQPPTTGIGLQLIQAFASQLHGEIEYETRRGATTTVIFPI